MKEPLKTEKDMSLKDYFDIFIHAIISLPKGMWLTFTILFSPKRVVTVEYPENKDTLKMHSRFRGEVIMPHNEEGEHNCTGCLLCEKACPNATISVLNTISAKSGKKVLGKYIYRLDQCTLCNLCIEACPFGAIEMGQGFENAATDKLDLTKILNKKEGRS